MAKVWPFTIIALIIIMIVGWYFYAHAGRGVLAVTTTVPKNHGKTTTVTSTIGGNVTNTSTVVYLNSCNNMVLVNNTDFGTSSVYCSWHGGMLGLWGAAGDTGVDQIIIQGMKDGKTYVNITATYNCTTFLESFMAPNQTYNFTLLSGPGGGTCGATAAKLNTTIVPPPEPFYNFIYNGNFDANYTGWNVTGKGFGSSPLNITHADTNVSCYLARPWSGYNSTFIATTFNCGLSNAPGNITSQPFKVTNKPYLNFKLVSPQDNYLYIEILYNNTPAIIAHYDTYNNSISGGSSASTFVNATIPLVTMINKIIRVKVVADTLIQHNYIAVSDFALGSKPTQTPGVITNMTIK
jgi:hypothetical protein